MKMSRADRSRFSQWSFTIDQPLLTAFAMLLLLGVVLSLAASPAVAMKKGLSTYHFFERHVAFALMSAVVMVVVSFFSPSGVRRLAFALLAASLGGMVLVLLYGSDFNGAQRWLSAGGYSLQPSEFAKPAFIVIVGWMFAEAGEHRDMPAAPIAFSIWLTLVVLLVLQPDVGQTALISATAGLMYILAGLSLTGAAMLLAIGGVGGWLAYVNFAHVHLRVDRFFNPLPAENFQVDRAMQSFAEGGLLGRGPGEGTIKSVLPDAHTDFIFAVIAEEYGVIACIGLLGLFAFIVVRALRAAGQDADARNRLAIQGLAIMFGLQALINISVNIGLLPPKGMTLPFISAGGSSMVALAIAAGMMIALTRRRADPQRLKKPRLVPTIEDLGSVGRVF